MIVIIFYHTLVVLLFFNTQIRSSIGYDVEFIQKLINWRIGVLSVTIQTYSPQNSKKIQNSLYHLKWIYKVLATIFNKQNQNRPIRTEDTACQTCATTLRWAYDVTWRHRPTAGNNITCNTLQLLFDCRRLY